MKKSCMESKVLTSKPKVLMYYSYGNKIGGPLTYINTLIDSELKEKYNFVTCYQNKAPGGVDMTLLRDMVKAIKAENPDIVHVHGAQSEGFYGAVAAKLAGCKHIVMTVHGFAFDDSNCTGLKHFLYRNMVEPLSLKLSDSVYCVCKHASERDVVVKNAGKRNCGYIHNPVPEISASVPRESIREQYHIHENDVVFAISARVTKEKGFDVLADTVKMLNAQGIDNFKLMVLGNGAYYEEFCDQMHDEIQQGQVIMIGQTNKVADYLNACDAFVFPSYHENLSIAILEAGYCGLPGIVSDVGGNGEIIKDGETGFLIKEFSPEAYANKIIELINNKELLKMMQTAIRKDIVDRFSLSYICEQVDEVYMNELHKARKH